VAVPPLVGFVMNRVGKDWMERLLYEIFVSNDETAEVCPSLSPRYLHVFDIYPS